MPALLVIAAKDFGSWEQRDLFRRLPAQKSAGQALVDLELRDVANPDAYAADPLRLWWVYVTGANPHTPALVEMGQPLIEFPNEVDGDRHVLSRTSAYIDVPGLMSSLSRPVDDACVFRGFSDPLAVTVSSSVLRSTYASNKTIRDGLVFRRHDIARQLSSKQSELNRIDAKLAGL